MRAGAGSVVVPRPAGFGERPGKDHSGHIGHIESILRDLFLVQFSRKRSRKMQLFCPSVQKPAMLPDSLMKFSGR